MATPKTPADNGKLQAIKMAMESIEKQYGKGSIMRLGERKVVAEDGVVPTGSYTVDYALGIGGIPRGRIIEIFGPEPSGKTTLALSIISQVQKRGGQAALIDVGHGLDPTWAKIVGVN